MSTMVRRALTAKDYEKAAREYLRSLPLEHFMEATPQARQRAITLASLALVTAQRPEVQVFNELLVQYPLARRTKPRPVVPDNMVVIHDEPIQAIDSYDVPFQPVGPFWILEYVSKNSKRKDYLDNHRKYERELKVPFYLLFDPPKQVLILYRHDGRRYLKVKPNEHDRLAIPDLELEVGLLDDWTRFWFRGELLPLPADLLRALNQTRQELHDAKRQLAQERQRTEQERQRADTLERELKELRDRLQRGNGMR